MAHIVRYRTEILLKLGCNGLSCPRPTLHPEQRRDLRTKVARKFVIPDVRGEIRLSVYCLHRSMLECQIDHHRLDLLYWTAGLAWLDTLFISGPSSCSISTILISLQHSGITNIDKYGFQVNLAIRAKCRKIRKEYCSQTSLHLNLSYYIIHENVV